jgi:UDP-2,3-diacylglucosamine pyrophosphatase LpxH
MIQGFLAVGMSVVLTMFLVGDLTLSWKNKTKRLLNHDYQLVQNIKGANVALDREKTYLVLSDFHRGNCDEVDYYQDNAKYLYDFLKPYQEGGKTTLILDGDIEDAWGYGSSLCSDFNPRVSIDELIEPTKCHSVSLLEREFKRNNNYYRIYGNHDDIWKKKANVDRSSFLTENSIAVYPGIILFEKETDMKIFVTHGCQGQPVHDAGDCSPLIGKQAEYTWFYFRHIFLKKGIRLKERVLEKARNKFNRQEKYLLDWIKENNVYLVAGHTHLPWGGAKPRVKFLEAELDGIARDKGKLSLLAGKTDSDNKGIEEDFIRKELQELKQQYQINAEYDDKYFNAGCCFAKNCIPYVRISFNEEIKKWQLKLEFVDLPKKKAGETISDLNN